MSDILTYGQAHGARFLGSLSESVLRDWETVHAITLPPALRRFLRETGGMVDKDDNGFVLWTIDRLQSWREVHRDQSSTSALPADVDRYLVCADYFDWSWAYSIAIDHGGIYRIAAEPEPTRVADDYDEFLSLVMRDDERLYPP